MQLERGSQGSCPCKRAKKPLATTPLKSPLTHLPMYVAAPCVRQGLLEGWDEGLWGHWGGFHLGTTCKASGHQGPRGSTGGCGRVDLHSQARWRREHRRAAAAATVLLPAPLLPMPFLPPGFFPDSQHHHPKVSLEEGICLLVCLFILCLIRGRREKKSHKQSTRLLLFLLSPCLLLPSCCEGR